MVEGAAPVLVQDGHEEGALGRSAKGRPYPWHGQRVQEALPYQDKNAYFWAVPFVPPGLFGPEPPPEPEEVAEMAVPARPAAGVPPERGLLAVGLHR